MDEKPPSVAQELNRKVLEAMTWLENQRQEKAISDVEYTTAVKALAISVLGLVDREVTEIISLAEKIPVHTFPASMCEPLVLCKDNKLRIIRCENDRISEIFATQDRFDSGMYHSLKDIDGNIVPISKVSSLYNKIICRYQGQGWEKF